MGADLEEECWAISGFGFVGKDADGAVGLEAVDDARARAHADEEPLGADGHAAIGTDLEGRAHTPDVGPPAAAGHGAQGGAFFALRGVRA